MRWRDRAQHGNALLGAASLTVALTSLYVLIGIFVSLAFR